MDVNLIVGLYFVILSHLAGLQARTADYAGDIRTAQHDRRWGLLYTLTGVTFIIISLFTN